MSPNHRDPSRRDFLKLAAGGVAAAALPAFRPAPAGSKIPIATQMWVVRKEAKTDLPGVLRALSRIGFQGVELADEYFGHSPKEIRRMLDDNGLRALGNHVFLESLLGEQLERTVELNQTLGARDLIVRSLKKEQYASKDAVVRLAGQLNEIAERLEPYAMRTGFHNHAEIFTRHGGEMAWNILADHTRADVVLQLDTGNAMHSRVPVDVVELLRRNPGRTDSTHIKPFSRTDPAAYVGRDELDWKRILRLMETTAGTEWYIIEYEVEGPPPLEALRDNLAAFRELLAAV
ncbi:MAG: sugar phosphate isomerase/epimerase [Gemmatimonadota bacterium]|nr:sugar phosphate isomerase/epimerase [Gemmatimonadota bacterium]